MGIILQLVLLFVSFDGCGPMWVFLTQFRSVHPKLILTFKLHPNPSEGHGHDACQNHGVPQKRLAKNWAAPAFEP